MLRREARRAASILHQTPGWQWRRKLCLTPGWALVDGLVPRSMQSSGQRRLPARQRHDAYETPSELQGRSSAEGWSEAPSGHVRRALPELQGKEGRWPVAPPERDPRGSGQHCFKELGRQRSCNAKEHAGSTAWGRADGSVRASAGGTARKRHVDECG